MFCRWWMPHWNRLNSEVSVVGKSLRNTFPMGETDGPEKAFSKDHAANDSRTWQHMFNAILATLRQTISSILSSTR